MTYEKIEDDLATSLIGEGVHTGLRKGTDAEDSAELWSAIFNSETSAWSDAVAYAVWCLDYMGYAVCKKVQTTS